MCSTGCCPSERIISDKAKKFHYKERSVIKGWGDQTAVHPGYSHSPASRSVHVEASRHLLNIAFLPFSVALFRSILAILSELPARQSRFCTNCRFNGSYYSETPKGQLYPKKRKKHSSDPLFYFYERGSSAL